LIALAPVPRARHGERQIGAVVDRLHPGALARLHPRADGEHARIVEEARPGEQRGIDEVRRSDFRDVSGARQFGDRAQIVRHDPGRGDPAVEIAAHQRLGPPAIGRRRDVLVTVDQAGQKVAAAEVDDRRAGRKSARELGVGRDPLDAVAADDHRHVAQRRGAGAIEHGRMAIDGGRRRRGLGWRRPARHDSARRHGDHCRHTPHQPHPFPPLRHRPSPAAFFGLPRRRTSALCRLADN
jgi:hypothetical protein